MESNQIELKEKFLMNRILTQRKNSAKKISNFLFNILYKNICKKESIIIKRLIKARKNYSIKIQSLFRGYLIRKKMQHYISNIRTSYLIETGFSQNFKNLQMIVVYNNKNKVYDLCFDKFFNKYIIFMDRTLIKKDKYKIKFINDGKIIIDSNYETLEEKGTYYNMIDFQKIKQNEEKNIKKNKFEILSACKFLKEKNLSLIPKKIINELSIINEINGNENYAYKSDKSLDISELGGSTRIETPIKHINNNRKIKKLCSSSFIYKKKKSCPLKGILKMRNSNRKLTMNNTIKVKFGDTEISE